MEQHNYEDHVYSTITFEYLNNIRGKSAETFRLQHGMTLDQFGDISVVDWRRYFILDTNGDPMVLYLRNSDLAFIELR